GRAFSSTVLHASAEENDELTLDLTQAYQVTGLQSLIRSFVWHKEECPRLELTDTYRYAGIPASWTERFVTWREPKLLHPGTLLLPGTTARGVEVTYDSLKVEPEITVHVYRDHFGMEKLWYSLDFHVLQLGAVGKLVFTFQFL
ncbi:hypothetical protein BSO21_35820, partial [Paenibacillus odorifer]